MLTAARVLLLLALVSLLPGCPPSQPAHSASLRCPRHAQLLAVASP